MMRMWDKREDDERERRMKEEKILNSHENCPCTRVKLQQYEENSPCLLIKGKIRDVDGARTLIDCRWNPQHFAIGINQHVRLVPNLIVTIGVVEQDNIGLYIIGFDFFSSRKNTSTDHNDGEFEGGGKDCKMMR